MALCEVDGTLAAHAVRCQSAWYSIETSLIFAALVSVFFCAVGAHSLKAGRSTARCTRLSQLLTLQAKMASKRSKTARVCAMRGDGIARVDDMSWCVLT